jgi:hypothetical protein
MMRPQGNPEQLEKRRKRAMVLLEDGYQPVEIAQKLRVDRRGWSSRHPGSTSAGTAAKTEQHREGTTGTSVFMRGQEPFPDRTSIAVTKGFVTALVKMEQIGIEPTASTLRTWRSPN